MGDSITFQMFSMEIKLLNKLQRHLKNIGSCCTFAVICLQQKIKTINFLYRYKFLHQIENALSKKNFKKIDELTTIKLTIAWHAVN